MLEKVDKSVEHIRFMDPISDFLYPLLERSLSLLSGNESEYTCKQSDDIKVEEYT